MQRVLLVEDSPTQARRVSLVLETEGFEVEVAGRLSEALQKAAGGRFDVLLLDLTLPDSEGLDTFLRMHAQAANVPTVILTHVDEESLAAATLRNGAQDYLVKNQVTNAWLARSLRFAIQRHRAPVSRASRHQPSATNPSLDLKVEETDRYTMVRIRDQRLIDSAKIEAAGVQLRRMFERDATKPVILNFAEVVYLSNAALGMLLAVRRKVQSVGGDFRLCNIAPELHEHFVVRRLDEMFDIRSDECASMGSS